MLRDKFDQCLVVCFAPTALRSIFPTCWSIFVLVSATKPLQRHPSIQAPTPAPRTSPSCPSVWGWSKMTTVEDIDLKIKEERGPLPKENHEI